MYIDIIGGGSLGLLYAAKLMGAGKSITSREDAYERVRLWTRSAEQAQLIRTQGIQFVDRGGTKSHIYDVQAYPLKEAEEVLGRKGEAASGVWLFVKQTHIDSNLLDLLQRFPRHEKAPLVCYQNGMGHMEALRAAWPHHPLIGAVTTEAAKRLEANVVVHTGCGDTWVGWWCAGEKEAHAHDGDHSLCLLTKKLQHAGFRVFLSNNIEGMVYQKLLVNVIINPLTAVLRVANGQLLLQEDRLSLMKELFREAVEVYRAAHIAIDEEEDWNRVMQVCRMTASNSSSMLQDVQAGRKTEIEAITGALIRLADRYKVAIPLHRMMYRLILAS